MAQINLPHTLIAGTPENVNDLTDNYQQIVDHFNNALVGDDNLTSPNNNVWRNVIGARLGNVGGDLPADTYPLGFGANVNAQSVAAALWLPTAADVAVAGKTTQIRVEAFTVVNGTSAGTTWTFALHTVNTASGGAGTLTLGLGAAITTCTPLVNSAGGSANRVVSPAVTLPGFATYVLTLQTSAMLAANSAVIATVNLQMRHT